MSALMPVVPTSTSLVGYFHLTNTSTNGDATGVDVTGLTLWYYLPGASSVVTASMTDAGALDASYASGAAYEIGYGNYFVGLPNAMVPAASRNLALWGVTGTGVIMTKAEQRLIGAPIPATSASLTTTAADVSAALGELQSGTHGLQAQYNNLRYGPSVDVQADGADLKFAVTAIGTDTIDDVSLSYITMDGSPEAEGTLTPAAGTPADGWYPTVSSGAALALRPMTIVVSATSTATGTTVRRVQRYDPATGLVRDASVGLAASAPQSTLEITTRVVDEDIKVYAQGYNRDGSVRTLTGAELTYRGITWTSGGSEAAVGAAGVASAGTALGYGASWTLTGLGSVAASAEAPYQMVVTATDSSTSETLIGFGQYDPAKAILDNELPTLDTITSTQATMDGKLDMIDTNVDTINTTTGTINTTVAAISTLLNHATNGMVRIRRLAERAASYLNKRTVTTVDDVATVRTRDDADSKDLATTVVDTTSDETTSATFNDT